MNIYKKLQPFIFPLLFYLLFGFFDISFFDTYQCDSGSINENLDITNDNYENNDNTMARDLGKLHFLDRVRRKVS